MMINNNPYNLPERPPNNKNRIYTESTPAQYRAEGPEVPTPYSQYLARQSHYPTPITPKNSLGVEDSSSYRQPYPPVRNEIKHFMPSPKNQNSNPSNNYIPSSGGSRATMNIGSSVDKKEPNNSSSLRDSFGVTGFDTSLNSNLNTKEISDRIQAIAITVRANEKRIAQLEKNAAIGFLPGNSRFHEPDNQGFGEGRNEWLQKFHGIQNEIQAVKDEIRSKNAFRVSSQLERTIAEKCRELIQSSKISESSLSGSKNNPEELKREVEGVRVILEGQIKKNFEFLTSVIGRLEREFHNGLIQPLPNFKPSPIKCSTTAILLRFVECFKVRKHGAKTGQIKITLTDNTYYIDSQGYLLDKEQYYIVDSRDCRIKLDDKHIKLLKEQNILQ